MGAWAEDAFGNDTACDWADDFSDNPNIEHISRTINVIANSNEYIDSDDACEALAACELVAGLKGTWGDTISYSDELDQWVKTSGIKPTSNLIEAAEKAIAKILSDDSELLELWDEDGVNEQWHQEMADLLARIKS